MSIDYDLLKDFGIAEKRLNSLPIKAKNSHFIEIPYEDELIYDAYVQRKHIDALPSIRFQCADEECARQNLYPASELFLVATENPPGYYCEQCIFEYYSDSGEVNGPRLSDVLHALRNDDPSNKQPKGEQK